MASTREEYIYLARLCESTARYETMIETMKKVINFGAELSVEERNYLSVAYKNAVASRRSAWRQLGPLEIKWEKMGSKHVEAMKSYHKKIEIELTGLCTEVIQIITDQLLPISNNPEAQVFYHKMKADYLRYISEYA